MAEIEDLIRLLVEAPAEDSPLARPKEFLDRLAQEKVAKEGIVPEGPATTPLTPQSSQPQVGAVANPKTAMPQVDTVASPVPIERAPGTPSYLKPMDLSVDAPAITMAPVTASARQATPKILEAISGIPAAIRMREPVAAAAATPKSRVEVVVPPAFPFDPAEMFAAADATQPPRPQEPPLSREFPLQPSDTDDLESTEAYVARSFMEREGNHQQFERWSL